MKGIFSLIKPVRRPSLVLLICSVLVLSLAIGTTVAVLVTKTDTHDNTFEPPLLRLSLEGYDDVTNIGNVPAYVRSLAVANWLSKEDEHTILSETPEAGVDFAIDFVTDGWFLASDGFYYYSKPLEPGESIQLIVEAKQLKEKEGYELRLELLSSALQNNPEAVEAAWPAVEIVDVNGVAMLQKRTTTTP